MDTMVWMDFLISGLKLNYIDKWRINILTISLIFIGDFPYPACKLKKIHEIYYLLDKISI